jgi:hypothetical protein
MRLNRVCAQSRTKLILALTGAVVVIPVLLFALPASFAQPACATHDPTAKRAGKHFPASIAQVTRNFYSLLAFCAAVTSLVAGFKDCSFAYFLALFKSQSIFSELLIVRRRAIGFTGFPRSAGAGRVAQPVSAIAGNKVIIKEHHPSGSGGQNWLLLNYPGFAALHDVDHSTADFRHESARIAWPDCCAVAFSFWRFPLRSA